MPCMWNISLKQLKLGVRIHGMWYAACAMRTGMTNTIAFAFTFALMDIGTDSFNRICIPISIRICIRTYGSTTIYLNAFLFCFTTFTFACHIARVKNLTLSPYRQCQMQCSISDFIAHNVIWKRSCRGIPSPSNTALIAMSVVSWDRDGKVLVNDFQVSIL